MNKTNPCSRRECARHQDARAEPASFVNRRHHVQHEGTLAPRPLLRDPRHTGTLLWQSESEGGRCSHRFVACKIEVHKRYIFLTATIEDMFDRVNDVLISGRLNNIQVYNNFILFENHIQSIIPIRTRLILHRPTGNVFLSIILKLLH